MEACLPKDISSVSMEHALVQGSSQDIAFGFTVLSSLSEFCSSQLVCPSLTKDHSMLCDFSHFDFLMSRGGH